jgi:hypothetical protein
MTKGGQWRRNSKIASPCPVMKKSVSSGGQPFESKAFCLSPKESILDSRAQEHGNGMSSVLSTLCCVE